MLQEQDLKKLERLAQLTSDPEYKIKLLTELNTLMNYVNKLHQIDTCNIKPLFHALELPQRMRPDIVQEKNHQQELLALAPVFANDLYIVPKVID